MVSSEELRGRATVLLFVTTFDLASQAEAKHLEDLYRTHKPRINAVAVVMEAPKYAPLARSFAEVLGLSYPVALADDDPKQALFERVFGNAVKLDPETVARVKKLPPGERIICISVHDRGKIMPQLIFGGFK